MQELIGIMRTIGSKDFIAFMQERTNLVSIYGAEETDRMLLAKYAYLQEPEKTAEELLAQKRSLVASAVQELLDTEAKNSGYDNIISACTYATSTGTFGAEGQSFVDWRDAVWTYVYTLEKDIMEGKVTEPTLEELIVQLPKRG